MVPQAAVPERDATMKNLSQNSDCTERVECAPTSKRPVPILRAPSTGTLMPIRLCLALSALYNATSARTQADQTVAVILSDRPETKRQSLLDKLQGRNKNDVISTEYDLRLLAPSNTHVGRSQFAGTIRRRRRRSLPGDLACVRQRRLGLAS